MGLRDYLYKRQLKKFEKLIDWDKKQNQSYSTFSWFRVKSEINNKTQVNRKRYPQIDWTEDLVINSDLVNGFYRNSYPGLKLAGAFAKTPIDKPIQFMGLPIPKVDNESLQMLLNEFVKNNTNLFPCVHKVAHLEGTCWIWPWYYADEQKFIIEFIPDETVRIIKNARTKEVIKIIAEEQIEIAKDDIQNNFFVTRTRIFTKEIISVRWTNKGGTVEGLEDIDYLNPIRALPIPFSNNKEYSKIRGRSDYATIMPDAKNYHDIDLQFSKMLAKFNIKQVQTTTDPKGWKENNGITTANDVDPYVDDFILNAQDEKTEYIFPNGAFDSYEKKLNLIFWKLVQGSGIPEIFWGLNAQGNHASVEDSRGDLIKYVNGKRNQHTESWRLFFEVILKLYKIVSMNQSEIDMKVEWNNLDAVDEKTRSEIFKNFSEGVSLLINCAGASKEQIYKLWEELYPQATTDDYQEWIKGISDMAKHKAFQNEQYSLIMDMSGEEVDTSGVR